MADILRESIPRAQEAIANAPRIVIGGGGPVGIEMAGEIADAYPDKTVTMVFAGFRLLDDLKGRASIEAGKKLNKLGIIVKSGNKVSILSQTIGGQSHLREIETNLITLGWKCLIQWKD